MPATMLSTRLGFLKCSKLRCSCRACRGNWMALAARSAHSVLFLALRLSGIVLAMSPSLMTAQERSVLMTYLTPKRLCKSGRLKELLSLEMFLCRLSREALAGAGSLGKPFSFETPLCRLSWEVMAGSGRLGEPVSLEILLCRFSRETPVGCGSFRERISLEILLCKLAPGVAKCMGRSVWQVALEWPSVWEDFFGSWLWSGQVCGNLFVAGGFGVARCVGRSLWPVAPE